MQIKSGCPSGRKVVPHDSKNDLPLISSIYNSGPAELPKYKLGPVYIPSYESKGCYFIYLD